MQFVLCQKSTCPKKETCFRYMALIEEGEYQIYNEFPAICNSDDNYKLFIRIRNGDKVKELELETKNKEKEKEGIN